jgi:RNA polymerase sigma-70 factor (ECF subfamily)
MATMTPRDSFAKLIACLQDGEHEAAEMIFQRFARQLVALARRHLDVKLSGKVDAEEVVQSAYKSFFLQLRESKVSAYNWQGLWGLLALITIRKCAERVRYFWADRRDVRRELTPATDEEQSAPWLTAINREPTPIEAAVLAETVERLLREALPEERPVIELSLQGYTTQEISEQLGRAERTVRRLRQQVKERLARMQSEDE